jgi:hypothetical protein
MTPEQLANRNRLVGEGQRRSWRDPEVREKRSAKAERQPRERGRFK